MHSAEALCAITNPTVNSYKRINAPPTLSGATWSPNTVTYARQQPHPHDPHSRTPAASSCASPTAPPIPICCRPRCWPPGSTASRNKRDPGKRLDINMYTDGHKAKGAKKLPLNLLDALRALEKSSVLKAALGENVIASYLKLKHDDWNAYSRHLTEWERQTTLDC